MPLASQLTGVGHYTFELAKSLAHVAPDDSFTLISPQPISIRSRLPENLSILNLKQSGLNRRWWSIGLPLHLSRSSFDLFHGTNYEVPMWSRRPSVVTIHDLSLFLHPEAHEARLVRRARWRMPLMVKTAARIITPTESVKREVSEIFKISPEKIVVTPEAPRAEFKPPPLEQTIKTRERFGIREEFVLFVGTVEPRKNLHRLVEAFDKVLRTTSLRPQLVIAGGQGWLMDDFAAAIKAKGLEDHIRFTGYIHDEDLAALYSSCSAFTYPSLYEGFGLPPLEAMACGAPVITSNIPAIVESVSHAARTVDPHDVDDIAKAIAELLSDEKLRQHYSEAGLERSKKFTWEQTARKTLEVYRAIHRSHRFSE